MTEVAIEAMQNAYAPYSRFQVGAALLTENGEILPGCNVENASYGLTLCAERTAVAAAVSQGHKKFIGVVVVTNTSPPSSPCGVCRQVLHEFAPDLPVRLVNPAGETLTVSLADLLPMSFDKTELSKGQKQSPGAE
ncbi:MAG: cytidine deaminase [Myxococcales bacterium]|nr:cytidine deaminase [Myxococcales bacterium]